MAQKGSFNSSDNTYTFETSHFTMFAIMQEKVSASKVVIPNKDLVSTNNLIYIGALLVGLGLKSGDKLEWKYWNDALSN